MRNFLDRLFAGRQGMDEFSKFLFWSGLFCLAASVVTSGILAGIPSTVFSWLGFFQLIYSFIRAFSRRLQQRETENYLFLSLKAKKRSEREAAKNRRSQRKDFRFYRCPGCKTWLRVPRGKGKIHINCKCGYTLYRKT